MFVVRRKLKGNNRWCVLICHSEREGKKVRQKTIKYFGVAHNQDEVKALTRQAKLELKKLTNAENLDKNKNPSVSLEDVEEVARVTEGFHAVMGPYFDKLGLASLLTKTRYQQLREVVLARIAQPSSKLHTSKVLQSTFQKQLSVDQIYKLMDTLIDFEDAIKLNIFKATQKRLEGRPVNLMLFDVTTLYFESNENDELRNFGYSKDHKVGEVQVVLALATTSDGNPVGYHLFPGNTAEVKTLLECIKKWRKEFCIENIIVVADRAMLSETNLKLMESEGLIYIVAAKLRSLPKKLKSTILSKNQESSEETGEEHTRIQEHLHRGRRLVIGYSHSRASKDRKDREKLIDRLRSKFQMTDDSQSFVSNRGYLKYVDSVETGKLALNEAKITEDAKWDGLHGVITNDQTGSALELFHRYRNLWVIEESFRINKHTLAMRPIYHFSPRRIQAHILICYLAFAVVRYTHQDVKKFDLSISIENLRDALSKVEVSILEDKARGSVFRLPAPLTKEASTIYKAMGLKWSHTPSRCAKRRLAVV